MLEKANFNKPEPNSWVDLYADFLYHYAVVRVNDVEAAKDLVQETFFSGIKSLQSYRGEATEKTWLVSILKRKIIDYYRKINSIKAKSEIKIGFYQKGSKKGNWIEEHVPKVWKNDGEEAIENLELKTVINNCVSKLSDKYKIVFLLKNVQNYETEEICKELDITSSNLWVILHRARLQLRNCLEKNWFAN